MPEVDYLLIGGGMAFTFLKAEGKEVGKSLLEENSVEFCRELLAEYGDKISLPVDVNVTTDFDEQLSYKTVSVDEIEEDEMGMDIGPETVRNYGEILQDAKTILWNGPLGVYEMKKYRKGTRNLLQKAVDSGASVILGGGDIVAAATELGFKDKVTHASTGGGAMLEYLEGKELPGIAILDEKE